MTKQKCNSNNTKGNLAKSSLTLNEWYSFGIQNYKTGVVKPSTIQNYCCIYNNHVKKFLGYMPLCEIRTMHIQQMHRPYCFGIIRFFTSLTCLLASFG